MARKKKTAAQKAWDTRRKTYSKEEISQQAKKAWATRRADAASKKKSTKKKASQGSQEFVVQIPEGCSKFSIRVERV